MKRDGLIKLAAGAAAIALGIWFARHTYWDSVGVPTPMLGEAAHNPYYSVEHLAKSLGIQTRQIASLRALQPDTVVWVSNLHDDLLHRPIESLQTWVEGGGRLIIGGDLLWSKASLQKWSGIKTVQPTAGAAAAGAPAAAPDKQRLDPDRDCAPMAVQVNGAATGDSLRVCGRGSALTFAADRAPAWSLSDARGGVQVLRVSIGLGELTVIGPYWIFGNRELPRADNAAVLLYSAGLRRGDTLVILSPSRATPLIALLWRLAAPAMLFLAAAVALLIVRNLPRFGPPLPVPQPVRRSLAEQIRAHARFAWRTRKLGSLRAAVRRSLDEAARRRIRGYDSLDARRRADSLAASTGIDAAAIKAALTEHAASTIGEDRAAITLLEVCRRILLGHSTKGIPNDR
jgi:hypothetical protein